MSTATIKAPVADNAHRLLWAGFMAILAAGVGFAVRGAILDNWGQQYGFSAAQLGRIGAQGLTGFCFGVIIGGVIADKIGYGKLVIAAFLFHIISAIVTLLPGETTSPDTAYSLLFWGSFIFALANGTLEAVANPLVATLFPNNRTHYLNILHASWPAGLVLGSLIAWVLDDQMQLHWKYQWGIFLVPAAFYGIMFLGQAMPKSEAAAKGLSFGEMMSDVGLLGGAVICTLLGVFFNDTLKPLMEAGSSLPMTISIALAVAIWIAIGVVTKFSIGSILLFILFATHALVGAVELGTDSWIQNITGNLFSSSEGKFLFIWTSGIMFGLRFCAHFIEKKLKLSPVGLLLVCAILACIGLNLTSNVETLPIAFLALGVYAIGKTFFWPTMLAVASDRFPKTGAVAISIMGGIGMMSGGLIGSTGLGYFKDRYSGQALQEVVQEQPELAGLYEKYKAEKPSEFLVFEEAYGLNGTMLGEAQKALAASKAPEDAAKPEVESAVPLAEAQAVVNASIEGDRRTLRTDSILPATMSVIYVCLLLYFASIGGYKVLSLMNGSSRENDDREVEKMGTAES